MTKKIVLAGIRPTGQLHYGHYYGFLEKLISLQDSHDCYLLIADMQVLGDKIEKHNSLNQLSLNLVQQMVHAGVNPAKTVIYKQSDLFYETLELTYYLSLFTNYNNITHIPSVKEALPDNPSLSFLTYPVSQAADIALIRPDQVLVGNDQLPLIELANKLFARFNSLLQDPTLTLPDTTPVLSDTAKIPGIGTMPSSAKMSKSLNNALYINDIELDNKIKSAYTDALKLTAKTPGHPDQCTIAQISKAFGSDPSDSCSTGALGCKDCKASLLSLIKAKDQSFSSADINPEKILAHGVFHVRERAKDLTLFLKHKVFVS